jgi:hypothetical protein
MRNILAVLLGLALIAAVAPKAGAVSYKDEGSPDSVWLTSSHTSQTWTFDLDNDTLAEGDIGTEDVILSATVKFTLTDDDSDHGYGAQYEYGTITWDGHQAFNGEIDAEYYSANVLGYVSGDHELVLTISRTSGDFGVCDPRLEGCYTDNKDEPVIPEPITLSLIGIGLAGMGLVSKRRKLSV